ncbi:periplasmic heavy metal sensor [candidate division KSB1 bacterium]|nr:periplasmic heavy metal sensor [candidate division KSB1 bacterium]
MKIRWLHAGLILSLAFNMGFLGAFVFQQIQNKRHVMTCPEPRIIHLNTSSDSTGEHLIWLEIEPDQEQRILKSRLHFEPKVHEIRARLFDEKIKLSELLVNDAVDTILIEKKIETIGHLQAEIEKEVVYQLLKEKDELDPEQSHRFLKVVTERLQGDCPELSGSHKMIIKKRFTDESGNVTEHIEINEEILED